MSGGLSGVAGNTSVEVGGARRKVPQQVGFVPVSDVNIILDIISVIIIVGNISVTIIVVSLNVVRFPNSNLS